MTGETANLQPRASRAGMADKNLGLPWTRSKAGNHNTDGVMITRMNDAQMGVYVAAMRFQGTIPAMCAEPLADEILHRVHVHHELVGIVKLLQEYLVTAAGDGAYDTELAAIDARLALLA